MSCFGGARRCFCHWWETPIARALIKEKLEPVSYLLLVLYLPSTLDAYDVGARKEADNSLHSSPLQAKQSYYQHTKLLSTLSIERGETRLVESSSRASYVPRLVLLGWVHGPHRLVIFRVPKINKEAFAVRSHALYLPRGVRRNVVPPFPARDKRAFRTFWFVTPNVNGPKFSSN